MFLYNEWGTLRMGNILLNVDNEWGTFYCGCSTSAVVFYSDKSLIIYLKAMASNNQDFQPRQPDITESDYNLFANMKELEELECRMTFNGRRNLKMEFR